MNNFQPAGVYCNILGLPTVTKLSPLILKL